MSKAFAYHVFAHDGSRYRTISAAGISELESKSLEQFFFGQTNDEAYLESLESEPGIIWRNLNGRGALTRVKNGPNDSNGRETLRFETILFPASQRAKASQKLDALVLSSWEFKEEGAFLSASNDSEPGEVHPEKISDVSMAVRDGGRVVRRATDFSLTDVAKIVSSCGDGADFSLCFKSLNNTAPVTVNLVSLEVPERNMNIRETKPLQSAPHRIQNESSHGRSGGDWIALAGIYAILAIQLITVGLRFSAGAASGDLSTIQNAIQNKDDANAKEVMQSTASKLDENSKKIITNTEITFAELKNSVFEELETLKAGIQSSKDAISERIAKLENSQAIERKDASDRFSNLNKGIETIDGIKKGMDKHQSDLAELKTKVEELKGKLTTVENTVAELTTELVKKLEHIEASVGSTSYQPSEKEKGKTK